MHRPWWRGAPVAAGVAALVVLGVGGVALLRDTRVGGAGRPAPVARAAFDEAMVALATAPAMRYTTTVGGGRADVRTTGHGASLGTVSVLGQRLRMLTVGGRTYVQIPGGTLPGTAGAAAAALQGRWIAGGGMAALVPSASPLTARRPLDLANSLLAALADHATLPAADDPGTVVDGVPALAARTRLGAVYVSRNAPHRLLRIEPSGAATPSLPGIPGASLPPLPPGPPAPPSGPAPSSFRFAPAPPAPPARLGAVDLPQLSAAEVDTLFRELQQETRKLADAIDGSVQYTVRGEARVRCGGAGCTVAAQVSGRAVSTRPDTTVTGGRATGQLFATVQVEGQPAGSCRATAPLPLPGTGSISCASPGSGAVYRAVEARKRAAALAQSRASGGRPVPYTILVTAQAEVVATARVQVRVLLRQLDLEARLARPGRPAAGRPPAPPMPSGRPAPQPTGAGSATPTGRSSPGAPSSPAPTGRSDCTTAKPQQAVTSGAGWISYSSGPGGRAGRGVACLKAPLAGKRTAPSVDPVGLAAAVATAVRAGSATKEVARCHIVAARLGGANDRTDNLVPCWHRGVNVGDVTNPRGMSGFENDAAKRITSRTGETMVYQVSPDYRSGASTVPYRLTMVATTFDPSGAMTTVDYHQVLNEQVLGRRIVDLSN